MRRMIALALALATAVPAAAGNRQFNLPVRPAGGQDFAVGYQIGAELPDYWCAAGRYVRRELRLPSTTRIYRLSPEPRRRGEGITFTLDPARSSGSTGFSVIGGPQDGSFSVSVAVATNCNDFDIPQFGFGR